MGASQGCRRRHGRATRLLVEALRVGDAGGCSLPTSASAWPRWRTCIAILIYAYEVGGSPALGLVAFSNSPRPPCSPRWGPRLVTVTAEVMLTVAALFAASSASVAIAADWPVGWVYFLAAVNATVLTLVRPFHESLLPRFARSTEQLTARVCRRWDHREPGLDRRSAPGRAHRDGGTGAVFVVTTALLLVGTILV